MEISELIEKPNKLTENRLLRKEIITPNLESKYTVYNDKTGQIKSYASNNKKYQKFRVVKFFKAKNATNYLGTRKEVKEYLGKSIEKESVIIINETQKIKTKV